MISVKEKENCKRKVRYGNDVAAQAALKKINPGLARKGPNRVYRCSVCLGWHLSSSPKH